ncbi:MAG: hypothetical protein WCW84_05120 [Sulfurimonas sp.]|jgi:hypothetical protein
MQNDIQVIDNDRKEILVVEHKYYVAMVYLIKILLTQYDKNKVVMVKNQMITIKNKDSIIYVVLPNYLTMKHDYPLLFNRKTSSLALLVRKNNNEEKVSIGAKYIYIDCYKDAEKVTEITIDKLEGAEEEIVEIPKLQNEKTILHITKEIAFTLIEAKKKLRESYYHIYIDKKTFEIMAISVCNKSNENYYTEIFNDDIVNKDNTREFDTIKVDKLFPIKQRDGSMLCIYKQGSVIYVKIIIYWFFDINYIITTKLLGYFSKLKPLTSIKLKDESIKEAWNAMLDLNKFKFTVHTEDKDFLDELLMLVKQLNIVEKSHNAKIKLYGFVLEKYKVIQNSPTNINNERIFDLQNEDDFFTLKITNGSDYTFSFDELGNFIEYDTKEENQIETLNREIILARINILKRILSFVKSKELYESTKIKSIGFVTTFKDKKTFDMIKLIKFNTGTNKDLYECFDYKNKQNVYTNDIYYKAYIPSYKEIIYKFQKENADNLSLNKKIDELSDGEIREILEIEISKAFKHSVKIIICREAEGLYYAKAVSDGTVNIKKPIKITKDSNLEFSAHDDHQFKKTIYKALIEDYREIIKQEMKHVKDIDSNDEDIRKLLKRTISKRIKYPVEIAIEKDESDRYYVQVISDGTIVIDKPIVIAKSIKLNFFVHMDNKSSFFKISHTSGMNICKNVEKETYCKIKNKLKYSYEVNGWDTKDEKILQKNNSQKYSFTLNDDLDDIINNITTFTSKYKLLAISYPKLIDDISYSDSTSFKTVKKFNDNIQRYAKVQDFIKISNRNLRETLSDLLNK